MNPRIANDYAPQFHVTEKNKAHPRYKEYVRYRHALAAQLVTAAPFESWLRQKEYNGGEYVYQNKETLKWGWHILDKNRQKIAGEYANYPTEKEARTALNNHKKR